MKFLKYAAILIACLGLTMACAPAAQQATQAPQVVKETVVVQQTVAPQVVQQTVVVPQVVTPTPVPLSQRDRLVLVHFGNPGNLAAHPWSALVEEYNRT